MRKKILYLICICFVVSGYSQQQKFKKTPLTKIKETFQKSTVQSVLFSNLKAVSGTEFRAVATKTDKLNRNHTTYQQYYKGIKVELGTMKLHSRNGIKESYNGTYFDVSGVKTSPRISVQQAVEKAKEFFGNEEVFWLTDNGFTDDPTMSIKKVILPNRSTGDFNLAYAIGIGTFRPVHKMGMLYIDAMDGTILKFKNQVLACFEDGHKENSEKHINKTFATPFATGTGYAAYTGSVNFETKLDGSEYVLNDETRATGSNWNLSTQGLSTKTGIITLDMRTGTDYVNGPIYEFTDTDNNWTPAEMITDDNVYAIDVHWGSELVYDFWKNENSWDSYNGNNSALMSLVHYDNNLTNAAWGAISNTTGFMLYGDGAGSYTPLTTLDVVAHEIAHGVNNATSNLDYEFESGALNEGLSDIWAMVIENYANDNHGTTTDPSRINDQNAGGALRSFSNPNAYNQPDTYGGTYWYDITGCTPDQNTNDYCGVHTNSGVLNYWFWLLHNGGSGTNDIGSAYDVTAIDVYDAADIVWQMQTNYLTSTSDYADARDAAIQAAIDLFGTCSQEEESVTNAFYAVGVGNEYQSISPTITTQPANLAIAENGSGQFSVTGTDYDSAQWLRSTDGNAWNVLTDDSIYSGTNTTTLTITNASVSYDGFLYRLLLENNCDNFVQSNEVTLTVTAYTSIPDSNFETALNALGYDDVAGDGQVPTNLIDTVTTLNVDGENISDLTGIEDFAALEELDADNNALTSINVSTLSSLRVLRLNYNNLTNLDVTSNTDLETLTIRNNSITGIDLSNNIQLKTLYFQFNDVATLDVTNNTALTSIICRGNDLTSIDLSQNTVLASFWAGDNSISSIDLSNNPLLTVIQLYNNNLTYADLRNGNNTSFSNFSLTGNSSLSCILVDDAAYATTNLTGIDSHTSYYETSCGYTAIPDDNFEAALEALGYDNISGDGQVPTNWIDSITSLDVSNKNISDITGIEDFEALEIIRCDNNTISSIDVSTLTNLIWIEISQNNLSTLDVNTLTSLITLNCDNNNITTLDLSNNSSLVELSATDNDLSSLNIQNGNNSNMGLEDFQVQNNPNLTCITVDNVAYADAAWTDIENQMYFSNTLCFYTAIPDSNFESALETLGYDDISGDGYVPTSQIESITHLDVSENNIADLTGIEGFIALTNLDASKNELTNLNFYNNAALDTLKIGSNNLLSLDVTQNTALLNLNYVSNDLTSVDISNNTELILLNNYNNNLTTLDISNNTKLEAVFVYANNLTAIDISNNPLLHTLHCGDNSIATIDTSNNSALEGLSCSLNNLTSLDLSNNPLLSFLASIGNDISTVNLSNNAAMKTIYLNNNDIANLDLSNCTLIEKLYIPGNNLTSLDLSNNSELSEVSLQGNDLSTLNVQNGNNTNITLFNTTSNANLTCISVDDAPYSTTNWTDIDNQTTFSTSLCGYTAVPDINFENALEALGYDDISSDGYVPTALIENVTSLNIDSQSISNLTGIEDFTALTILYANDNQLTSVDLSNNVILQELEISENQIPTIDFSANTALTYLDLFDNGMTTIDVSTNTALTYLNLNTNSIATLDLSANTLLNELILSTNPIASIDLSANILLTYLDLQATNITSIDLTTNTLLENLDIGGNGFTSLDLSNNTALTNLDITNNNFTSIDLSTNVLLETLLCFDNQITSLDLTSNTSLERVAVYNNNLSFLDIRNGNNTNITYFLASNNPDLTCALVDDVDFSNTNWSGLDTPGIFSDTYCRYTAIPDSNFEAALEALGYDDISGDGQVPTDLIEVVTILHVSDENISNLTGIEDFTALVDLNVQDNSLSSLDLSNNLLLEDLNCAFNKFFFLDLSNNTLLNSLYADNGWLIELDVSGNPQLEYLYLANNNSLNSLNYKNGNNTNTQFFNTTGCANLNCILVDDASYSTTNWTSIEAETSFSDTYCNYTAIPDANFEAALDALGYDDISSDGQVPTALIEVVTILDISNENIADLTGIEDFEALDALDCSNNQLTEVYFGSNVPLTYLDLSSNNLTTLESPTSIVNLLVNSNNLLYLDLTSHVDLQELSANNNDLIYLNLQNGANTNIYNLITTNNADLTCIRVDDVLYSETNWSNNIDDTTSFSTSYCKYTQVPDANFEARLESLGLDDISGDGQVPTGLIVNYESIDLSLGTSGSIYDLTGIQDFYALYNLILTDNVMTNVDVSANVNLGLLTANNTALTSIDLSSNSNLNYINLSDCDDLSSVNIKNGNNNTKLVGDSSFTALNVPNLFCVLVDDELYANVTWINNRDPQISFSDTYCRYTAIPDANFEARLETLGYDDISGDGQVPTALIEVVTELDVSSKNISDLTGIEDFIALQDLDCEVNSITSLDLSNNTLLETIDCDSNDLTLLDFGNNTVLKTLICNNSTSLGSLDLSNNTGLEYIQLTNNGLTSININGLTALTTLGIDRNDLTGIDLSTNTALEIFTCSNNTISSLDLANNINLTYVLVDNNALTNVDVTNSTGLEYLYCSDNIGLTTLDVTNNTSLLRLSANNNSLSSIDVSNNVLLEKLWVTNNLLTSLIVDNNTALEELVCYDNNLTALDVSANTLLDWLYCDGNSIESLDLTNNTALTSFNCSNNALTSLNLQNGSNTSLTFTVFTDNPNLTCVLVDDAAYSTTNWTNIDGTTSFSETYCRYTAIPDANFEAALEAQGYDDISGDGQVPTALIEVVTSLNIENLSISDITGIEDFIALSNLEAANNTITSVDLSNNVALTSIVLRSNSLTSLDIENNTLLTYLSITSNGITTLDTSNNTSLESLYCNDNSILELDVSSNVDLKFSNFSDNQLTNLDLSANTLLQFSSFNNNNLTSLNLKNGTNEALFLYITATGNSDLTCVLVDNATYSTTTWTGIDLQTSFSETSCDTLVIAGKVFLQGAALNPNVGEESLMRDDLRIADYIPTTSPYTDVLTIDPSVLTTEGNDAIVDWIWVELRDATTNTTIVASQSALLQRDGDIVAIDGISNLEFDQQASGDYYIAIKHRNHLGIMTSGTVNLSSAVTTIDFTDGSVATYGTNGQTTYGMPTGVSAMWAGDPGNDGRIKLIGTSNDSNEIRDTILNDPINQAIQFYGFNVSGYNDADVNLTGGTQIIGSDNDANLVRDNILNHPINSFIQFYGFNITEQLPEEVNTKRIALDIALLKKVKALETKSK